MARCSRHTLLSTRATSALAHSIPGVCQIGRTVPVTNSDCVYQRDDQSRLLLTDGLFVAIGIVGCRVFMELLYCMVELCCRVLYGI